MSGKGVGRRGREIFCQCRHSFYQLHSNVCWYKKMGSTIVHVTTGRRLTKLLEWVCVSERKRADNVVASNLCSGGSILLRYCLWLDGLETDILHLLQTL